MRFEFTSSEHRTILRAVLEDGDRTEGTRQEGAGTAITYSGQDIEFDYGVTAIHPDLLGLLCLIIFYPFVGERVVLPVLEHLDPMRPSDVAEMEKWSSARLTRRRGGRRYASMGRRAPAARRAR